MKKIKTIQDAFEEYIISIRADGLAEATVKWYTSVLSQFILTRPDDVITAVTRSEMRSYIASLTERETRYEDAPQKPTQNGGLSLASVESHKRALSAFWNWC